jgi:hypothetical protein
MVDTVWIRLTTMDDANHHYMFGSTGVVSFGPHEDGSTLRHANGTTTVVQEDAETIFNFIHSIRHPVIIKVKKTSTRKR